MENYNIIQELAEMSGAASFKSFRYVVPIIRFNGSTNKFVIVKQTDNGYFEEAGPIEVVGTILKIRRSYGYFKKAPGNPPTLVSIFTNEHDKSTEDLFLYSKTKGEGKAVLLSEGKAKDLRTSYPELRMRLSLYMLVGETVMKMNIKGKSLSNFFNYLDSFKANEHVFEYSTRISSYQENVNSPLSYYVLKFAKEDKCDLTLVSAKIKEVNASLKVQDLSNASTTSVVNPTANDGPELKNAPKGDVVLPSEYDEIDSPPF